MARGTAEDLARLEPDKAAIPCPVARGTTYLTLLTRFHMKHAVHQDNLNATDTLAGFTWNWKLGARD